MFGTEKVASNEAFLDLLKLLHEKKPDSLYPCLREVIEQEGLTLSERAFLTRVGDKWRGLVESDELEKIEVSKVVKQLTDGTLSDDGQREIVREYLDKRSAAKPVTEPTCFACKCVEARACSEGCAWVFIDATTNYGFCTACWEKGQKEHSPSKEIDNA